MEVDKKEIICLLGVKEKNKKNAFNKKLSIPKYQRNYAWAKEDVERLFDDVKKCAENKNIKEHFFGSLFVQDFKNAEEVYVIDGQQRLITLSLFMKAINLVAKKNKNKELDEKTWNNLYLKNEELRINPSDSDSDDYKKIMGETNADTIDRNKSKLTECFRIIYDEISSYADLDNLYGKGFKKLSIAYINLEENDDAQLIFESINALGKKLTQADLIRNYLLIAPSKEQEELYKIWKNFDERDFKNYLEEFFRCYLMMKTSARVDENMVYRKYKAFVENPENGFFDKKSINRKTCLEDLERWKDKYHFLEDPKNTNLKYVVRQNQDIIDIVQELIDIKQKTSFPFLMRVINDIRDSNIDDVVKVFNLILVYSVRRSILGVSNSNLRDIFLRLYRNVFPKDEDKEKAIEDRTYYAHFYKYLHSVIEFKNRMPSIEEVEKRLPTIDLYSNSNLRLYLLNVIENGRYGTEKKTEIRFKEGIKPSVEHIIPQDPKYWVVNSDLGLTNDFLRDYTNTIGNLTILALDDNTRASNKTFEEKKKIMLKNGYGRFENLNGELLEDNTIVNAKFIKNRGISLTNIVKKNYELKEPDNINKIKVNGESNFISINAGISDYEIFDGIDIYSFTLKGEIEENQVRNYKRMFQYLVERLYAKDEYKEKIKELAQSGWGPWRVNTDGANMRGEETGLDLKTNDDKKGRSRVYDIEDITLTISTSEKYCVYAATEFLKKLEIDPKSLIITAYNSDKFKIENAVYSKTIRDILVEFSNENFINFDPNYETNRYSGQDGWIKFNLPELDKIFNDNKEYDFSMDGRHTEVCQFIEYATDYKFIRMCILRKHGQTDDIINKVREKFPTSISQDRKRSQFFYFLQRDLDLKNLSKIIDSDIDLDEKIIKMKEEYKKALKEAIESLKKDFEAANFTLD